MKKKKKDKKKYKSGLEKKSAAPIRVQIPDKQTSELAQDIETQPGLIGIIR